jgi:hypothetical protein
MQGMLVRWLLRDIFLELRKLMSLTQDIQAALATEETTETKLIAVLTATLASNKALAAQLTAAIAANDPATLQPILDKVNADNATMQAAVDAATPPTPAATA